MSSLRSSAIPLTVAHVSNVCRGMSGDSVKGERGGRRKDGLKKMQHGQRMNRWELVFYGVRASACLGQTEGMIPL